MLTFQLTLHKKEDPAMPKFDQHWIQSWERAVNDDVVARLLGRHFNASVMLEFGDKVCVAHFQDGAIQRVDHSIDAETCYAFALRAPVETWSKFVQPEPPPMYNDIIAMSH